MENDIFVEDRVRFFVNVPSWFSYMKERDITIGGRLHGNIAGVLCGCAPIFIPQDARMRELVEYHHFPPFLQAWLSQIGTLRSSFYV